jgi:hypothetical protein
MLRIFTNALIVSFFLCVAATAKADTVFFKVCEDYRSGQYRDCEPLDLIEFSDFGIEVLHVYADLTWAPDGTRQHPDIYLRWIHRAPDGKETIVADYPAVEAYRWRPSRNNPVTRWHVQATIWRDLPGTFIFQAYTDLSAVEESTLEELSVPVLQQGDQE